MSDLDSGKNFIWGGGVLEPNPRTGVFWGIWSKIYGSLACWCITDSLSHTTYVETKKQLHRLGKRHPKSKSSAFPTTTNDIKLCLLITERLDETFNECVTEELRCISVHGKLWGFTERLSTMWLTM